MTGPASRRDFLRGLTALPLIGGGVTLIGAPSAVAAHITEGLLDAYSEWLYQERRLLCRARYFDSERPASWVPTNMGATDFHFPRGLGGAMVADLCGPSTRAALVLSAVGCDWRCSDDLG